MVRSACFRGEAWQQLVFSFSTPYNHSRKKGENQADLFFRVPVALPGAADVIYSNPRYDWRTLHPITPKASAFSCTPY